MDKPVFSLYTAIAYTSGKPHIGNTYEIVLADAISRFKRLTGYDVYFQTGTDEHGQKIEEKARAAGVTPQQYVDDVAGQVRQIWDIMDASYDRFVRTTDKDHEAMVQRIFQKLYDQGDIYKSRYEGMYCTPCESFWTESQLVDGKCPDCGRPCKPAQEEAYFFRMSKYAPRLMEHIEKNPQFIQPESRKNEMVNNFLKPGLQDLCVTRSSFTWGVPVSFDPRHVVYVWIDALSNYITFPGYDPDGSHGPDFQKYWPADVHLIGKDILRFHTIYWPILLMALDLPLPKQIFGHPWLLMGDGKMSKSKGNVLYADDLARQFGVDAVRYYLLHEMPFGSDGVMTYELLMERINSDLANILGNLVNRTVAMSHKYSGGVLSDHAVPGDFDQELIDLCLSTPGRVREKMDGLRVADAIDEIFTLLRRANKYIDETLPWVLAKDEANHPRLDTVLYNLLETIRFAAVLLSPFLPETALRICRQLNIDLPDWDSLSAFGALPAGHQLGQGEILFARIDVKKTLEDLSRKDEEQPADAPKAADKPQEKAEAKAADKPAPEAKPEAILFDDFAKVEMTVVKVLSCERVKKSEKLLKFQLDDGTGTPRQILSGIAKYYAPEELVGKTLVACTNLAPRKMMGQESRGMLLSAEKDDRLDLIMVSDDIPAGAKLC